MKIQTFKNNKGLIHGSDKMRIGCDIAGTLVIGSVAIIIPPDEEAVLPSLYNGVTGEYKATFTSALGNEYDLGKVQVNGGRLVPPTPIAVELMELRCRVDALEAECEALREENIRLAGIFDTNSLNFLIH